MAAFTRAAAILVGLTNLIAIVGPTQIVVAFRRGEVGWNEFLPPVLAVVIAGLAASEIALRWFRPGLLGERFLNRYGSSVVVMCIGGTLTGGLLAAALTLNRTLVPGPPEPSELILVSLLSGLAGAEFGLVLGLAEGLLLALPIAAVLGLVRDRHGERAGSVDSSAVG